MNNNDSHCIHVSYDWSDGVFYEHVTLRDC